ncbi:ABC transporter ATP-binding protein uup-1 [Rubrivivax sp. A210]|uniref:ATP-binding cassette domain-containing protein n=1 Tax=Rubrivivax sp. A210 TaxID=2772301 RepID=UPI00191B598E|nr:ATP-binding cassette domain-containing protein [Rubrivivax sp. A210]CAD5370129.1 ABC transporter ATP-binding protein uup-1 [Rubrivivax sp. A210]
MALLTLADAHLAYGHVPLLDGAALALEAGERVALIGRNGAGKSSLLKILAGLEKPDDGQLQLQGGLRRVYVAQEPLFDPGHTVFEAVSEGVAEARELRERFERHAPEDDLDALQTRLEALGGWTWEQRVEQALQRLRLPPEAVVDDLSGGTRKRVALARALVTAPELLLLDEPTNHLDVDAIEWLQELLRDWRGALVLVSHDRAFIDAVATRIVELDRGQLRSYPGSFATYEATKARELQDEALANARAEKLLAQEEVWIRKGVEARRTRSVGRVARLVKLREQRAARRDTLGQVRLEVGSGLPPGKIVAELTDVGMRFGDKQLITGFTATILRGDKVGLIGPNGSGKTTLLKLILGELQPTSGKIRQGARLQVAYFDQMRAALDLDATLADTISPGSEWIEIGEGPKATRKHVMSYLTDFLFSPERANSPVRTLSGGERNRLLLARLFALPANVLVLDEPTNDLDIDTLELLEELLQSYAGTVFLVSHDRRFLDNVVTSTIAWEGDAAFGGRLGLWREYEGGYEDWKLQRSRAKVAAAAAPSASTPGAAAAPARSAAPAKAKLSYKEQRELDGLPARIEALEAEQSEIHTQLADGSLYGREPQRAATLGQRAEAIEGELMAALERWELLGSRQG